MAFLRNFLAALLALVVFSVVVMFLFFGFIAAVRSSDVVVVPENSILRLDLNGTITELQIENPLEGLPSPIGSEPSIGLLQLKESIQHAQDDPKIKGILVNVSQPYTGFSSIAEIRSSLESFRKSGKWVWAYSEGYGEGAYYLATAADRIFLNPSGELEFDGLKVEMMFFKRLLDRLEIRPEVFRVGEYKSAVEPFLLEKMSKENRQQLTELVDGIYKEMLGQISVSRDLSPERLKELSENLLVTNPEKAYENKLVDSLIYQDQLTAMLKAKMGLPDGEDLSYIDYSKYRKSFSSYSSSSNEIAVIVAEGTIVPGSSMDEGTVASERFRKEIRKARENERVKAIVLRVNSPGGTYQATDVIWREVKLASEEKPVIASMSDYAASGGYYISAGCDTIVADPNSITGSIGIYGVLFDLSGFLGNKLGITFDEVKTGKFTEPYAFTRPLSPTERKYWQTKLDENYGTFKRHVAEGRHMTEEEVEEVAKGRVWTGQQALERHLVDRLGSFDDAVQLAAQAAGVAEDYRVRYYPKPKSFIEQVMSLEEGMEASRIREKLGNFYEAYKQWSQVSDAGGSQARLPFQLTIW